MSFFENFYASPILIKQEGINDDLVEAGLPIPMVATRDIAEAAAKALNARDWKGVRVRELLGPVLNLSPAIPRPPVRLASFSRCKFYQRTL